MKQSFSGLPQAFRLAADAARWPELEAVRLRLEDAPVLQDLLARCLDYHELVDGEPASPDAAYEELTFRPSGASEPACFGLRDGAGLAGVICALPHYPVPDNWYVGLMLLEPGRRGAGLGRAFYLGFEDWLREQGAHTVMLAIVEANSRAGAFWESHGFAWPRCFAKRRFGQKEHMLIEYEKRF
jgi:GNAT superfamily N-acetyltransferase